MIKSASGIWVMVFLNEAVTTLVDKEITQAAILLYQ